MKPPESEAQPENSLLDLFWDLQDSNTEKRLRASDKLATTLLDKQQQVGAQFAIYLCKKLQRCKKISKASR